MTHHHNQDRDTVTPRWAPWWVYLIILLGANYLRSWMLPTGQLPAMAGVGIAVGQAFVLFVLITLAWRLRRRSGTGHSPGSNHP